MESEQGKLGAAGRDRHGFRALLICLLALVVLPAHFPAEDRHLFWVVVVTLCLLVCLYMAANNRVEFVSGAVVAACAMILSWLAAFLSNSVPLALPVLFYVLFFLMVAGLPGPVSFQIRQNFRRDDLRLSLSVHHPGFELGIRIFPDRGVCIRILCQHTSH